MLALLQDETAHAIRRLTADAVYPPLMLQQSLAEFGVSPEGVGWLQHMETLLFSLAKMGRPTLEYRLFDQHKLNDTIHDPLCPLYAWFIDVTRKAGAEIFEQPTVCVIRTAWKHEHAHGALIATQVEDYLVRGIARLAEAWRVHSDVPVHQQGYCLLFDWSKRGA